MLQSVDPLLRLRPQVYVIMSGRTF